MAHTHEAIPPQWVAAQPSQNFPVADKILLVDDEPAFLTLYQLMMPAGVEVHIASGGKSGLGQIREHGPFALVISDMRMPGINGVQFLAQVREAAPESVRMMLTGFPDFGVAVDAVNQGNIFRLLAKRPAPEAFLQTIARGLVQRYLLTA